MTDFTPIISKAPPDQYRDKTGYKPEIQPFKTLRIKAGLSVNQAARLLSIDPVSVRRFEMDPDKSTSRNPPELALKVLYWYRERIPPDL